MILPLRLIGSDLAPPVPYRSGAASIYRPRRPERTDLHLAIRENLRLFCPNYDVRFFDQDGPLMDRGLAFISISDFLKHII